MALDGERDQVRLGQRRRLGREIDVGRIEADPPAGEIGEGEAVGGDLGREPLAADQADADARRRPGAADEAADRAGAEDRDCGQMLVLPAIKTRFATKRGVDQPFAAARRT